MRERPEWDDEELVAAANRGEEWGAAALYNRYKGWVLQVARRLSGDPEVAEDVMQETFSYLITRFPGFELRCPMKGFLYPVVRFRCAQVFRDRGPPLRSLEAGADEPGAAGGNSPAVDSLARLLAQIPDGQREVMILRYVDSLSLREIADALEIPEGTVKSRIHKSLERLRSDPVCRKLWKE